MIYMYYKIGSIYPFKVHRQENVITLFSNYHCDHIEINQKFEQIADLKDGKEYLFTVIDCYTKQKNDESTRYIFVERTKEAVVCDALCEQNVPNVSHKNVRNVLIDDQQKIIAFFVIAEKIGFVSKGDMEAIATDLCGTDEYRILLCTLSSSRQTVQDYIESFVKTYQRAYHAAVLCYDDDENNIYVCYPSENLQIKELKQCVSNILHCVAQSQSYSTFVVNYIDLSQTQQSHQQDLLQQLNVKDKEISNLQARIDNLDNQKTQYECQKDLYQETLKKVNQQAEQIKNVQAELVSANKIISSMQSQRAKTIYTDSDSPDASQIKEEIVARKIPFCVHVTNNQNISSIMEHGILTLQTCNALHIESHVNDKGRWDFQTDSISVSIASPNIRMFWNSVANQSRSIILLSTDILWKLPCEFCYTNAANRVIARFENRNKLVGYDAFRKMFWDTDNGGHRKQVNLPAYLPTDIQAEVLVHTNIPCKFILKIMSFEDFGKLYTFRDDLQYWQNHKIGRNCNIIAPTSDIDNNEQFINVDTLPIGDDDYPF